MDKVITWSVNHCPECLLTPLLVIYGILLGLLLITIGVLAYTPLCRDVKWMQEMKDEFEEI